MSQVLSNLGFLYPLPSSNNIKNRVFSAKNRASSVNALTGENRDNLDHLQRSTNINSRPPQNPQIKKRTPPVSPSGLVWEAFPTKRTVEKMMETMERMLEDPVSRSGRYSSPIPSRGRTPWEIKEAQNEYKMRFDMPGMTRDDVKVWVEENSLIVKAEKKKREKVNDSEKEEEEEEWSGESYGEYSSRIALPENIQFENIKAEVKDGVLYINIPKSTVTASVFNINVQ